MALTRGLEQGIHDGTGRSSWSKVVDDEERECASRNEEVIKTMQAKGQRVNQRTR